MDLQWWESSTDPHTFQYWVNVRDRETGVSVSMQVSDEDGRRDTGWTSPGRLARIDLERAITERVRSYLCFTLACQVTASAPVLFAGGPLDGTRQDLRLAEGSKPERRHTVIVDPVWALPPPQYAFHKYERGEVPQLDPDEPVVWLYRHVDEDILWARQ